jgi:hypothetical protein
MLPQPTADTRLTAKAATPIACHAREETVAFPHHFWARNRTGGPDRDWQRNLHTSVVPRNLRAKPAPSAKTPLAGGQDIHARRFTQEQIPRENVAADGRYGTS